MKYTKKDDELIIKMMSNSNNKSLTSKALAEELNRSVGAIKVRYYNLIKETKQEPVKQKSNVIMFLWNKFTHWLSY